MPVYKNQKRDSWYCSFYYKDWNGTRRRKKKEGFKTKKAAKEYEAAFLASKSGNCNMPFRCMAELYLEDCKSRCKSTSYYEKEFLIQSKIIPSFGDMAVSEIKPSAIRLWQGCQRSGVHPIRLHDLRHSHASLLIELGASPLLISERLGHEKVETTLQIYSHLYPDKQAAVADLLDEIHNSTFSVL